MKVSVICTNYNKEKWIAQAIEGVIRQSCDFDYELLIIDDASTDGSPQIIQEFQKNYSDLIRVFVNQENLGITKTWKKICPEAKGDYIARLDGDDFWIDSKKLQKQVDYLEQSKNSRWCTTDFNIVDASGVTVHSSAIKTSAIRQMTSFELELAHKGMTGSSTWLVERDLLLQVTEKISEEAVDDTFNLQLELFKRTELAFLPDVTTAYRMLDDSDSHSNDFAKLSERLDSLYQTQLRYYDSHQDLDHKRLILALFEEVNGLEKGLTQKSLELKMTSDYVNVLEKDIQLLSAEKQRVYDVLTADRDKWFQESNKWHLEYQKVVQSRRWRIPTKIINLFRGKK